MTRKTVSKVLELRELSREAAEADIREARAALRAEQDRLDDLERRFAEASSAFGADQQRSPVALQALEDHTSYCAALAARIRRQQAAVAARTEDLASREKILVDAYRDQRLVEILHRRIVQEEQRELRAGEQKENDERFLQRRDKR